MSNVLIIYASYSGSTQAGATIISDVLQQQNNSVTIKEARNANPTDIQNADIVLLGTPSWDFEGKEGQPHEDVLEFMTRIGDLNFPGKPAAIFGMGDTSYANFCGAVDILEDFIAKHGLEKKVESLRVDRYFTNPGGPEKVTAWAQKLATALST